MARATGDPAGRPAPPPSTPRSRLASLTMGLAVLLVAVVFRVLSLWHGLPTLVGPDEPVVLGRAQLILHHHLPTLYDWPTGAMMLLAGWLKLIGRAGAVAPYRSGRVLFALVSIAVVPATGLVGAALAQRGRRWTSAVVAMAMIAVAYPAVRVGRTLHPDPLQALFVDLSLLTAIAYVREPRVRWAIVAGATAGFAAGTKYLGGLAAVAIVIAILTAAGRPWSNRVRDLVVAGIAGLVGVVIAVPALLTDRHDVIDGLRFQFSHESGGHLGYDSSGYAFWFHLTQGLPGTWGWPCTVVVIAGAIYGAIVGDRAMRIVIAFVVLGFVAVGVAVVEFPHYVLVYAPALAAVGAVAAVQWLDRAPIPERFRGLVLVVLVVVLLAPTAANDARLLRAQRADDTQILAIHTAESVKGPLLKEQYTDASSIGTRIVTAGTRPAVVHCGCTIEISSYNEERYRREPRRYRAEVAVYDALRAEGRVVAIVAPDRPLSYRWDGLPQWGVDTIPLSGPVGAVGPTITFLELPPAH